VLKEITLDSEDAAKWRAFALVQLKSWVSSTDIIIMIVTITTTTTTTTSTIIIIFYHN
jgi:hypothetical protein